MLWQGIILQNLASLYYLGNEISKAAAGHDLPMATEHPAVVAHRTPYAGERNCDSMSAQAT